MYTIEAQLDIISWFVANQDIPEGCYNEDPKIWWEAYCKAEQVFNDTLPKMDDDSEIHQHSDWDWSPDYCDLVDTNRQLCNV